MRHCGIQMLQKPKGHQRLPANHQKLGRGTNRFSLTTLEGTYPANTLILEFWLSELWADKSHYLNQPVCRYRLTGFQLAFHTITALPYRPRDQYRSCTNCSCQSHHTFKVWQNDHRLGPWTQCPHCQLDKVSLDLGQNSVYYLVLYTPTLDSEAMMTWSFQISQCQLRPYIQQFPV